MFNINKNTFFIGLLVVTNLLLLDSCSCSETPQQKLEKKEKELIGDLAKKLQIPDAKKKDYDQKVAEAKKKYSEVKEIEDFVEDAKEIQQKLGSSDQMIQQTMVLVFNHWLNELVGNVVKQITDPTVAKEVTGLCISLFENWKEQIEQKGKSKK